MSEEFFGGLVSGLILSAIIIGIFQIGLNAGIKTAVNALEKYPEARNLIINLKSDIRIIPFVQKQQGEKQ